MGFRIFFINRPFPHSCERRHQLKVQVDKIQWFVRNCPPEPHPHFYVFAHWSIDFSLCNYDNILFLLLNWGSPFPISPVASFGLLLYNLWQSNKLSEPNCMRERSIGGRGGPFPKKFSPKTTVYKSCKPFYLKKKKNLVIEKKKFPDSWLNKNSCPTHGISK